MVQILNYKIVLLWLAHLIACIILIQLLFFKIKKNLKANPQLLLKEISEKSEKNSIQLEKIQKLQRKIAQCKKQIAKITKNQRSLQFINYQLEKHNTLKLENISPRVLKKIYERISENA